MGCRGLQLNSYFSFVGDDKPESPFPRGNRDYKSIAEGFIITDYVDASGTVQGHYEYSPFGKITASIGAMEDDFDYRFSSEVADDETGLVYYNYRYYSPELGRWLSRDPIGEKGGFNLYAMVGNGVVNAWDRRGLDGGVWDIVSRAGKAWWDEVSGNVRDIWNETSKNARDEWNDAVDTLQDDYNRIKNGLEREIDLLTSSDCEECGGDDDSGCCCCGDEEMDPEEECCEDGSIVDKVCIWIGDEIGV